MDIMEFIPTGRENAVSRKYLCAVTGTSDRAMRHEIHKARRENVILNLQDGGGYYIPDLEDPIDVQMLSKYIQQEESRLRSIGWSLKAARKEFRNRSGD